MRSIVFSVLLVCCASCQHSGSRATARSPLPADSEVLHVIECNFEGATYYFRATRGIFRQAPRWDSGAESPPVTLRQAERAARQRLHQLLPEVKGWNLAGFRLRPTYEGSWIYLVGFSRNDMPVTGQPSVFEVPVLLDGRALPATITK